MSALSFLPLDIKVSCLMKILTIFKVVITTY